MITLLDALTILGEDSDVFDDEYDIGVCWCVPEVRDKSDYAEVFWKMASEIEYVKRGSNCLICKVSEFVRSNLAAFVEFTKDMKYSMTGDPGDLDNDVEIGLMTVSGLVAGFVCDEDYGRFLKILDGES